MPDGEDLKKAKEELEQLKRQVQKTQQNLKREEKKSDAIKAGLASAFLSGLIVAGGALLTPIAPPVGAVVMSVGLGAGSSGVTNAVQQANSDDAEDFRVSDLVTSAGLGGALGLIPGFGGAGGALASQGGKILAKEVGKEAAKNAAKWAIGAGIAGGISGTAAELAETNGGTKLTRAFNRGPDFL